MDLLQDRLHSERTKIILIYIDDEDSRLLYTVVHQLYIPEYNKLHPVRDPHK